MTRRLLINFIGLACALPVLAQSFVDVMPMSPYANGSGGIYVDAQAPDPLSVLWNPATLGFLSDEHAFLGSGFTEDSRWDVFGEFPMRFSARAAMIGFSRRQLSRFFGTKSRWSVGLAYAEKQWDYGEGWAYMPPPPAEPVRVHPIWRTSGINLGAAWHYRLLTAGVGLAQRFSRETGWEGSSIHIPETKPLDAGLRVSANVSPHWLNSSHLQTIITPVAGYAIHNLGPSYAQDDNSDRSPLPRDGQLDIGIAAKLNYKLAAEANLTLVTGGTATQALSSLVDYYNNGAGYSYLNPLGYIKWFDDLILGQAHASVYKSRAFEFSALETISYRTGVFEPYWTGFRSNGYSLQSSGIFKLLRLDSGLSKNRIVDLLTSHVNVIYSHAHWKYVTVDGTFYDDDYGRTAPEFAFDSIALSIR